MFVIRDHVKTCGHNRKRPIANRLWRWRSAIRNCDTRPEPWHLRTLATRTEHMCNACVNQEHANTNTLDVFCASVVIFLLVLLLQWAVDSFHSFVCQNQNSNVFGRVYTIWSNRIRERFDALEAECDTIHDKADYVQLENPKPYNLYGRVVVIHGRIHDRMWYKFCSRTLISTGTSTTISKRSTRFYYVFICAHLQLCAVA